MFFYKRAGLWCLVINDTCNINVLCLFYQENQHVLHNLQVYVMILVCKSLRQSVSPPVDHGV